MGKCGKCRSKIGFFGGSTSCANVGCDYEECASCSESKNSNLKACKVCGELLCPKHIDASKHLCEEKDESGEEKDSYTSSSDNSGTYAFIMTPQDGNLIEFKELTKAQAEEAYTDIKKALTTQQNWYELDVQKRFGKDYSFEKVMINLSHITHFKIEEE